MFLNPLKCSVPFYKLAADCHTFNVPHYLLHFYRGGLVAGVMVPHKNGRGLSGEPKAVQSFFVKRFGPSFFTEIHFGNGG